MAIFTILTLPIHEPGRYFHLMRPSISVFRGLKFLSYRSFTCLVRVTPRYFILFVAIVKGVVSLNSFSACLSFV
ncbi:mCG147495 [Mus musculus]|nr:mCG147495 [Mus musculus]